MKDSFGARVRAIRQSRGWSQQELAMRAGVSTPHISSIERDKRRPSLDYAKRLADALGVPLEVLCDADTTYEPKRMRDSVYELPTPLQHFVLNEDSFPYLEAAHRMSQLSKEEALFLRQLIDVLAQKKNLLTRLRYFERRSDSDES
ncbi:helix-turn-helix domain-containing protein [Alicyclobacillus vulcanalis]|uniref:Helix-turn-helix n=1 Tax=Alicyclobacillus vulcanalis TaxID=252246 RepID=A0A1N7KKQ6_9BACL|nr:helix-turn-helix transcriptional regulator [Alicyclobacillus vulcanalis]SIS62096.1 Helix-turn-helix [Alicyclobacillus vulcanalis]